MGKTEGQENNVNGQMSSNLKQSAEASRRRQASGQTEGFASPAPATGSQAQPITNTVESQLQKLIGLVQARQQHQRQSEGLQAHQAAPTQQASATGTGFNNQEVVNHQYLGQTGGSSGQESSNENQANYNQAQVKQGESASDVKNTSSLQKTNNGGQAAGQTDMPAGGALHRLNEASNQVQ